MRKLELSRYMSKWSVHLSGYDIQYEPRTAIKSQALADFMSDFSPVIQNLAGKEILNLEESKEGEACTLHTDGASNQRGAGVGLAYNDSLLIGNHVNDTYTARDSKMIAYLKVVKGLKQKFKAFKIVQVPRDQNVEDDALATLGATFKPTELSNIPIVHVLEPGIQKLVEEDIGELEEQQDAEHVNGAGILVNIDEQQAGPNWRKAYLEWLMEDKLPTDQREEVASWTLLEVLGQDKGTDFENLRKRLEELGGKWEDELPLVLWSDRTTPKMALGQIPFSLVFGAEAVIPSEILVPTHRYGCMTGELNHAEMIRSLDIIDELRTSAQIRLVSYKQSVARSYNKNVKIRFLEVGDLVLRKVF
ncbi:uncharacterized protein LOC141608341 [Silene latifolia]|uniref:uncharacterized protein LOC141608341 n=1 Tax=Silene latifolia TaxID=37657 RepID=UPI003D7778F2